MTVIAVVVGVALTSVLTCPWWMPKLARRMQRSIEPGVTFPVEELRPPPHVYDLADIAARAFGPDPFSHQHTEPKETNQ